MKLVLLIMVGMALPCFAQSSKKEERKEKKKSEESLFKDTTDGKFDISRFLIDAKGVIPVPKIITEPALGNFGLMLTPVFIKPNKPLKEDSLKYTPPDLTAGFAGYTLNGTWAVGGMHIGFSPKYHLKYRFGGGYANVNMDFFQTLPDVGEQKFSFNFKTIPVFVSLMKRVAKTDLYLGLQYTFLNTQVNPEFDGPLPEFLRENNLDSRVSSIGAVAMFDTRDNFFTPNKGLALKTEYMVNASWTGSDYDYQRINFFALDFIPIKKNWISGFRFEYQQVFNNPPFYLLPMIAMRGVPKSKYQGKSTFLLETEQRVDFVPRWSGVGFLGAGKAFGGNTNLSEDSFVFNAGIGFRYLMARLFGLRVGVDVAISNEDWGYYIVFGQAWNSRG